MFTTAIKHFITNFHTKYFIFSTISCDTAELAQVFLTVSVLFEKKELLLQQFCEFTGLPTYFLKFCVHSFIVPLDVVLFTHANALMADGANSVPKFLLPLGPYCGGGCTRSSVSIGALV